MFKKCIKLQVILELNQAFLGTFEFKNAWKLIFKIIRFKKAI